MFSTKLCDRFLMQLARAPAAAPPSPLDSTRAGGLRVNTRLATSGFKDSDRHTVQVPIRRTASSLELALQRQEKAREAELLVQQAEFDEGSSSQWVGSSLCIPPGVAHLFDLPDDTPEFACAYLRARSGQATGATVDLTVVLDKKRPVTHGPPSSWPAGTAARVQRGELALGVLRIHRLGQSATASASSSASAAAAAAPRLGGARRSSVTAELARGTGDLLHPVPEIGVAGSAAGGLSGSGGGGRSRSTSASMPLGRALLGRALKVGVSQANGGCEHMEDECLVHAPPLADFAFVSVFDGHGGKEASEFCREQLHHHRQPT